MSRAVVGEAVGTGLLLYLIVGSGISAETLGTEPALQLLAHAIAVGSGLGALIALFAQVSGSHFNPAVTLAFWRDGAISGRNAAFFVAGQLTGAIAGVALANLSFGREALVLSATQRSGAGLGLAEGIGTLVLVGAILVLVKTGRATAVPVAVGAWVTAIVFATSSTGFANPAVTLSRVFADSYTGIAPGSVALFVGSQLVAGLLAVPAARFFASTPSNATIAGG